jgi:hypothetical protein
MNKEKTASAVIKKIKEEKIAPEPKWKIKTRDGAVWFLFFLFIFWGGLISSLLFSSVSEIENDLFWNYHLLLENSIPLLWLLLASLFLTLALIIFQKTARGYRYHWELVLLILILAAGALALGLKLTKPGRNIEGILNCPYHKFQEGTKKKQWSKPETGFLGGKIQTIQPEAFILEDFKGNTWLVPCCLNVRIKGGLKLKENLLIKIIGQRTNNKDESEIFEAEEIRPWQRNGTLLQYF